MKNTSRFRRWVIEKLGGHVDMSIAQEKATVQVSERKIIPIAAVVEVDNRCVFNHNPTYEDVIKKQLSCDIANFIKEKGLWSISHSTAQTTGNPLVKATVYIVVEEN